MGNIFGSKVKSSPPVATRNPNDPANMTEEERAIQGAASAALVKPANRNSTILAGRTTGTRAPANRQSLLAG